MRHVSDRPEGKNTDLKSLIKKNDVNSNNSNNNTTVQVGMSTNFSTKRSNEDNLQIQDTTNLPSTDWARMYRLYGQDKALMLTQLKMKHSLQLDKKHAQRGLQYWVN